MLSLLLLAPLSFAEVINSENIKRLLEAKNPAVEASRLVKDAAEEREGYFLRSFLPSVEAYGGKEKFRIGEGGRQSQPTYGAEARVNLFRGGKDLLESRARDLETEKREFQTQRVLSEEIEKARALYWQIIYTKEKIALLKVTLDVNKQNLESAQRRIRSGVATDSDRFEFEMKDVDLRRELAKDEVELATRTRFLLLALGLKGGSAEFSEGLGHDHEYEKLLQHSMKDHEFLFKADDIQAEQLAIQSRAQSRAWWPKIDAFAAFNQYNEREKEFALAKDRKESVVGLVASVSLPAGLESFRESAALGKESAAAAKLADYRKQEVEVHIQGEMAELNFLHDQVHEAEENIQRAERYYKSTQSEYSRGVKNSPDVLGAAEKLFDMRHKRLEIVRDFQLAKAHVLSKIGK